MRVRMKSRTVLLCIIILAAVLAAIDRGRHSQWAKYYSERYRTEAAGLPAVRKAEAAMRASGQVKKAEEARAWIAWRESNLNRLWWHWLKAVVIDEP